MAAMPKTALEARYEKACRNCHEVEAIRSASAVRYKMVAARLDKMIEKECSTEALRIQLAVLRVRARDYQTDTLMQIELQDPTEEDGLDEKLRRFQQQNGDRVARVEAAIASTIQPCFLCEKQHKMGPENCPTFIRMTPTERAGVVARNDRCLRCIIGMHKSRHCEKPPACKIAGCYTEHHWMLNGAGWVFPLNEKSKTSNGGTLHLKNPRERERGTY